MKKLTEILDDIWKEKCDENLEIKGESQVKNDVITILRNEILRLEKFICSNNGSTFCGDCPIFKISKKSVFSLKLYCNLPKYFEEMDCKINE